MGAALVSMVANLTLGSEKCVAAHEQARVLLGRAEAARKSLQHLIQADSEAFAGFSRAMKMPKNDEAERATREKAMQEALVQATEVPLEICRQALEACELSVTAAEIGNATAVSDAGVGAALAEAAVRGGALNVEINVGYLKDKDFAARAQAQAEALVRRAAELREQALRTTASRL